jgi:uncharacterized protein YxjI
MGLFGHDDGGRKFVMREKLLSIGDDYWIEDDDGEKVFRVNGKAMRARTTFVLEDTDGNEVVHIQDRVLNIRGTMKLERDGEELASVHKALVGFRDRFDIDVENGEGLKAKGNVIDHEYEVKRDGDVIATVSKKWFRARETYGIEIAAGEDEALLLAVAVAIDELAD